MPTDTFDCAVTDRGGIIENMHRVHAAVVDANGTLLFAVGDPSRVTLARSAAKPAQALAIMETGAHHQFRFDDADIALMCASHNSEDRHISRAAAMLARVPAKESDLRCGGHAALSERVNHDWVKRDYHPTALCNNCSGKHVGMLAGARAIGTDGHDYHLPTHPMQLRVSQVVAELTGAPETEVKWGLDGCNLPAPAFPLHYMGRLYCTVASAADEAAIGASQTSQRTKDLASIYNAMVRYPEMVAGEDRFCTTLMGAFDGAIIGKLGADGCYGVGVRASPQTMALGADGALGIAVKIEDGSIEILYAVVMEILEQLHIGTAKQRSHMGKFHHLQRRNTMGVCTGNVTLSFKVRAARE